MRKFIEVDFINDDLCTLLNDDTISTIKIFALGPEGTNIFQASEKWIRKMNICQKAEIILCNTPEEEVIKAMDVQDKGVLAIFALCAVYYDLCDLYFKYQSNYFFLSQFYMKLDTMQLASKKHSMEELSENILVARHRSPKMLLDGTHFKFVDANSNASAAKMCSEGKVDACITTESARKLYGLNSNYVFGRPVMLFTFGTTEHGSNLLLEIKRKIQPTKMVEKYIK